MNQLHLSKKLRDAGLVLLPNGKGWLVTNNGTVKTLSEKKFKSLDDVKLWFDSPARRLSEQESDEYDADWEKFCVKENKEWRK
jgi:hypothetical protein